MEGTPHPCVRGVRGISCSFARLIRGAKANGESVDERTRNRGGTKTFRPCSRVSEAGQCGGTLHTGVPDRDTRKLNLHIVSRAPLRVLKDDGSGIYCGLYGKLRVVHSFYGEALPVSAVLG